MIVAPEPVAVEAGGEVLRRGGNAVDAAITTAFIQGVVDPMMCGLGGGGVMLVYEASTGQVTELEFHARAGSGVREDQWERLLIRESVDRYGYVLEGAVNDVGYQSVGVPGSVAGYSEALRRFGTITWREAITPAIQQAQSGMQVTGHVFGFWNGGSSVDMTPNRQRIAWTAESRRIYTDDGALWPVGTIIPCPDYARTLERLASGGAAEFYTGSIADDIAADFAANDGFITSSDLASYEVHVLAALRGSYRGHDIYAPHPPAGGLSLLQMLNYLEGFDVAAYRWPSVEAARQRAEAMAWALEERVAHLADPLFTEVPVAQLSLKEYAAAARSMHDSPTTTHINVVDGAGNAVSMTHTLGSSSGVITPGLGFTYNNYLNCFDPRPGGPNSLAPGKSRITMMAPAMVLSSGRLEIVAGAPGGTRIANGVLSTLVNLIDHQMDPVNAVSAPRIDVQGRVIQAEHRIPVEVIEGLQRLGHEVVRRPVSYDPYFAEAQAIRIAPDGTLQGAADPRSDGGYALLIS